MMKVQKKFMMEMVKRWRSGLKRGNISSMRWNAYRGIGYFEAIGIQESYRAEFPVTGDGKGIIEFKVLNELLKNSGGFVELTDTEVPAYTHTEQMLSNLF